MASIRLKRVSVAFDKQTQKALKKMSDKRGKSISRVVESIVEMSPLVQAELSQH